MFSFIRRSLLPLLALLLLSSAALHTPNSARADVKLAGLFADHTVLQRDAKLPVWGWAEPGEQVTVKLAGKTAAAKTDDQGRWRVELPPLPAGGPHVLEVAGTNRLAVKDVLVGEVWVCSGQSNMAMTVSRAKNFELEKAAADLPRVRMFKVAANAIGEPQKDCEGAWSVCSAETVGDFSATGYFFGRKLHEELDVPVGLINSSWGGTDIAAWTSMPAQQAVPSIVPQLKAYDELIAAYDPAIAQRNYEKALDQWKKRAAQAKAQGKKPPRRPRLNGDPKRNQNRPANLFNGMINPLIPYAIRGATWYQGERNSRSVESGKLYAVQLPTLIEDWRQRWGQDELVFLTVQLPNFRAPQKEPVEEDGWVMVREAELRSLRIPNTGIAITTDVGEAGDIHPKNKQAVGLRLALWALGTTYDQDLVYSGPIYAACEIRGSRVAPDGKEKPGQMKISFNHLGEDLKTSDGKPLRGFALAGEDRKFHAAKARIVNGQIMVSSVDVVEPIACRYNWAANPNGNLVNSAGLPAAPFRTDRW